MGYQESFLFCKTKKDVTNLCRVLNKAQDELDDYGVYAFAVMKYKKPIYISNFYDDSVREHSKKGYCVWWGGERHPIQSGMWLQDYMIENFNVEYATFHCIFCDYIDDMDELLSDVDQSKIGVIQKTDFVDILCLSGNEKISIDLVKKL